MAFDVLISEAGSMPDGALIVKENYTVDGTFDLITVMYKLNGYNPDNNDWFWAKVKVNGEIGAEGQEQGCRAGHSARRDNNFVLTGYLR